MEAVDVLAFSPHPDDAEIGCGGALALAAAGGLRVGIAELTAGERATRGDARRRAREAALAAERLGVEVRLSVGLADGAVGHGDDDRRRVAETIRRARPLTVLAPHPVDRHPDHRSGGRLVRDACFEAGLTGDGAAPHRPARLFFYMLHTPFSPSFIVDVSPVWEQRSGAVAAYASQFAADGDGPATALMGGAFLEMLEIRARWFGAMIGARHGEPFASAGPVALTGLPHDGVRRAAESRPAYSMW